MTPTPEATKAAKEWVEREMDCCCDPDHPFHGDPCFYHMTPQEKLERGFLAGAEFGDAQGYARAKSEMQENQKKNPGCDATCLNYCLHADIELKQEIEAALKRSESLLNNWANIYSHAQAEIAQLKQANAGLVEALESIAALDHPKQDQMEYWLDVAHRSCALTLAEYTEMARKALAAARKGEA